MLRPVGSASSTSRVITVRVVMLCVSTTGDSAETVIVSSSAPTLRSALIVAVKSEVSSTFSRLHDAEAREREGDGVDAGPQRGDLVLARVVGDRRSHFFDQRGARRFDRHAGQHRARRVLDDAADALVCAAAAAGSSASSAAANMSRANMRMRNLLLNRFPAERAAVRCTRRARHCNRPCLTNLLCFAGVCRYGRARVPKICISGPDLRKSNRVDVIPMFTALRERCG